MAPYASPRMRFSADMTSWRNPLVPLVPWAEAGISTRWATRRPISCCIVPRSICTESDRDFVRRGEARPALRKDVGERGQTGPLHKETLRPARLGSANFKGGSSSPPTAVELLRVTSMTAMQATGHRPQGWEIAGVGPGFGLGSCNQTGFRS